MFFIWPSCQVGDCGRGEVMLCCHEFVLFECFTFLAGVSWVIKSSVDKVNTHVWEVKMLAESAHLPSLTFKPECFTDVQWTWTYSFSLWCDDTQFLCSSLFIYLYISCPPSPALRMWSLWAKEVKMAAINQKLKVNNHLCNTDGVWLYSSSLP